jgi:AraC-like DNA-binding protein
MAPIDNAIAAIEALEPGEKLVYQKIADQFGVDRSTLARRHRRVQLPKETKYFNQQKLTPQQEEELVQYIEELTARHIPPTREMIANFASAVAREPVSESWVTRFINKYSIHLISKYSTGMDANRHNADSYAKYELYFNLLQRKIAEYKVDAEHTYNMDEKGFMIGVTTRTKHVFSRRMWEKGEVKASLQDGNRAWVTVLACVCGDRSALPPGLIYESANSTIQSSWVEEIKSGEHSVLVSSSPSGWTNNEVALA